MPRDNEFLKQNQATQFVKNSTDVLQKKLGGVFNNTTTKLHIENVQVLKRIDFSLNNLNKILEQTKINTIKNKITQTPRDFIRRKDPDDTMRKDIADMELLLRQIRDNDEKYRKKPSFGSLSSLLSIGGLLGYLLSGKQEFLFSTIKGFTKYIGTGLVDLFKLGGLGEKFKKLFSGIGKIGMSILSFNFADVGKMVKGVFSFVKSIGGMFVESGFKGVMSGIGKTFVKGAGTAAKSGLKKIPVVGSLIGLMFGISRFRKGDWIGGLLEIASGISSIVPGVGTALGVAIDGLLLFRDFKGVDTGEGSANEKLATGVTKVGGLVLKSLPGIGTVIRMKEAFDQWKSGNKIEALKELGMAVATIIPGAGLLFNIAPQIAEMFSNNQTVTNIKDTVSNIGQSVWSGITNLFGGTNTNEDKITGAQKGDGGYDIGSKVKSISNWGKRAFGIIKPEGSNSKEPSYKDHGFNPIKYVVNRVGGAFNKVKNFGIKLYDKWNPNFEGLEPSMKLNFMNMAKDYFKMTGNDIQVNSAKRNGGGKSVHDHGFAIDINSDHANKLESMGLLQKYGFHRPLLHWSKLNEPWHVEPYPGEDVYGPRNTINNAFRVGTLMNNDVNSVKPEQGGDIINLPRGVIENKLDSKTPIAVLLSDSDINKLAMAFGEQLMKYKPKSMPLSNNQALSGRKF